MKEDTLYRGSLCRDQFRFFAAETTITVQTARDLHDLAPLPSILMGRLITAAALMSGELKAPKSELSLRVEGDGALKGGIALADKEGNLKGYAFEPKLWLQPPAENFLVGKNLGQGILTIMKQSGLKAPYSGTIELVDAEIANDLAHYYLQSEQLPTAVNLGVLIDPSARIRSAGGFIIQQLPFADTAVAEKLNQNLMNTPNVSDLMDMGLGIMDILKEFVFKDIEWKQSSTNSLRYYCNCSKERFARALLLLGEKELSELSDGISPVCHYCNTEYHFSIEDLQELIQVLKEPK